MFAIMRWMLHELGNGRAVANACRDRDELELLVARVDALGRRVAEREAREPAAA